MLACNTSNVAACCLSTTRRIACMPQRMSAMPSWPVGSGVMIERDGRGHSYSIVRGEILGFMACTTAWRHLGTQPCLRRSQPLTRVLHHMHETVKAQVC